MYTLRSRLPQEVDIMEPHEKLYYMMNKNYVDNYWECISCQCNYNFKKNARLDGAGQPFVRCPQCGYEEDL